MDDLNSLEEMEVCVRQPEIITPEDILEQLHLDKELQYGAKIYLPNEPNVRLYHPVSIHYVYVDNILFKTNSLYLHRVSYNMHMETDFNFITKKRGLYVMTLQNRERT